MKFAIAWVLLTASYLIGYYEAFVVAEPSALKVATAAILAAGALGAISFTNYDKISKLDDRVEDLERRIKHGQR